MNLHELFVSKEQRLENDKKKYEEYLSDAFYQKIITDPTHYYHQLNISKLENPKPYKTETVERYYYCERCDINSMGKSMCPCPRGSCEASIVGKLVRTKEIIFN